MEIQEIRRARLAQLIQEKYEGSQAKFIEATGENQSEVSALLRNKSFGERKARKLEAKARIQSGWLDIANGDEAHAALVGEDVRELELIARIPLLSIVAPGAPTEWMALIYVTRAELELLTNYRRASEMGRSLIETAAESAITSTSGSGSSHQS